MKTSLRLTLTAFGLVGFTLSTAVVQAQFNYTTASGTIIITGYTGSGGAVTIPSEINGLPVISIEGWLGTSGPAGAFSYCTNLTSVLIPDSFTTIGTYAFWGCTSLTNVTLPDSLTTIGQSAFHECTSLTTVTVPDNVTSIDHGAFSGCTSLTSVTIGNSVTSIGIWSFLGCTRLSAIDEAPLNPAYSSLDGVLFNKSQTTLIQCPEGKAGGYAVPNGVTSIADAAFFLCTGLTSVTIPGSVLSIGSEWVAGWLGFKAGLFTTRFW